MRVTAFEKKIVDKNHKCIYLKNTERKEDVEE